MAVSTELANSREPFRWPSEGASSRVQHRSALDSASRGSSRSLDPVPAKPRSVLVVGSDNWPDSMEWHVVDALQQLQIRAEFFAARSRWGDVNGVAHKVMTKLTSAVLREPELLIERRLLEAIEKFAPEMILVLLGNQLSPKTIARIRARYPASLVCWCQDQMTTLGRQYLLGAEYDAVFVKDRYLQSLFSQMISSTRFHYLAEACNPRVHRSIPLSDEDRARYGCDVMIAGTLYYYRQEILKALEEFELKVWGGVPDWLVYQLKGRHMARPVVGEEKVRAATAARVALNSLHFAEVDGLNCRAFELAGCGAFQLCTSRPVLAEHFIPGVEIETFASIGELVEKIRHYLQHPEEAAAIARRGQLRAHQEHTYERRLAEIFAVACS
jgi:spore maturation protein CgeB